MNFKDLPVWLKGGLIGAVIYFLIAVIGWFSKFSIPAFLDAAITFLFSLVAFLSPICYPFCPYFIFLAATIIGFLTGALIALIYKKTKLDKSKI